MHGHSMPPPTPLLGPLCRHALPLLLVSGAACAGAATPAAYTLVELKAPAKVRWVMPLRMNNLGQVVGTTQQLLGTTTTYVPNGTFFPTKVVTETLRESPVVWKAGVPTLLPPLVANANARAYDMDDAGVVVGSTETVQSSVVKDVLNGNRAVVWKQGKPVALPVTLGARADRVNKAGVIKLYTTPYRTLPQAYVLTGQATEPLASHLPANPALRLMCDGFNDQGNFYCNAYDTSNFAAGIVQSGLLSWVDHSFTPIQQIGATQMEVQTMSRGGVMAGYYNLTGDGAHTFVFTHQSGQTMAWPVSLSATVGSVTVSAVNDKGAVVAQIYRPWDGSYAVGPGFDPSTHFGVWSGGGFADLTAQTQALLKTNEYITGVMDINEAGQILATVQTFTPPAGDGYYNYTKPRYVVFTPK
jgi:hypothetical protein